MSVIEWFDAHAITRQEEGALLLVPERKGKHPVQARQRILAPLCPCSQQYFRVRLRAKVVAFAGELFAQLSIVVNLAVEDHDVAAVVGKHWLMPGGGGIDD